MTYIKAHVRKDALVRKKSTEQIRLFREMRKKKLAAYAAGEQPHSLLPNLSVGKFYRGWFNKVIIVKYDPTLGSGDSSLSPKTELWRHVFANSEATG